MEVSLRFFAISLISISYCFNASLVKAETFIDPTLDGKYIFPCIKSYRFSDACSPAATSIVAEKYCIQKGYSRDRNWQTVEFGWKNHSVHYRWAEVYVDGKLREGWIPEDTGLRFTVIECY